MFGGGHLIACHVRLAIRMAASWNLTLGVLILDTYWTEKLFINASSAVHGHRKTEWWPKIRWVLCTVSLDINDYVPWWRHQMETFSALLALCAGKSPFPVNSPHKGQWRGALMFSLICVWINDWVNNHEASVFRRYRAHNFLHNFVDQSSTLSSCEILKHFES